MRRLVVVLAMLAVAASSMPVQAKTVTLKRYYEGPFVLWSRVGRTDPTCSGRPPCTVSKDGVVDVGAVTFPPLKGKYKKYDVTIRVRDDYDPWGQVALSACEDTNLNNACSTTGGDRLWTNTCLTRKQKLVLRGVRRDRPIRVTIQAAYSCTQYVNDVPSSQGGGTSGVVLLSYRK